MSSLVIGEALVDETRRDGEILGRSPGGSPLNVAIGLARLGVDVGLISHIGEDDDGRLLREHLAHNGVQNLATPHGTTSMALAHLASDGSARYRFDLHWNPTPEPGVLEQPWTHLHIGSAGAFSEPGSHLIDQALQNRTDALVTFDPNIRPDLVGPHTQARARFWTLAETVDVVKLSDEDAEWLAPDTTPDELATAILAHGPRLAVVTYGARGATLATERHRAHVDATPVEVADTIGAGDAYMATLIDRIIVAETELADLTPDDLRRIGDAAATTAAITVARPGADPPTTAELAAAVHDDRGR